MKTKENGWYSCSYCPNESSFLYFFEIMAHYREIHGLQTLLPNSRERTKYDKPIEHKHKKRRVCLLHFFSYKKLQIVEDRGCP